jgi:hypothetical protein
MSAVGKAELRDLLETLEEQEQRRSPEMVCSAWARRRLKLIPKTGMLL